MNDSQLKKLPQWNEDTGYSKGGETRTQILYAALKAFGNAGYDAVTTRQIASAAGVNLPAIRYYFGNKEGLYLSCARELVQRMRRRIAAELPVDNANIGLHASPAEAKSHLKLIFRELTKIVLGADDSQAWAGFAVREMRDHGPAYEVLYTELWKPGIDRAAHLLALARGQQKADETSRLETILLISSLAGFTHGRNVSMQSLEWNSISPAHIEQVTKAIDRQIDALVSQTPLHS